MGNSYRSAKRTERLEEIRRGLLSSKDKTIEFLLKVKIIEKTDSKYSYTGHYK